MSPSLNAFGFTVIARRHDKNGRVVTGSEEYVLQTDNWDEAEQKMREMIADPDEHRMISIYHRELSRRMGRLIFGR